MENGLWAVASTQLEKAAMSAESRPEKRAEILILLAESLVREGDADKAISILEQSDVRDHPDAPFWMGQALAGVGRYSDAVASLLPLAEDSSARFREEAGLTAASLQLSLGVSRAALDTLALLSSPEGSPMAVRSKLHRMEILLDLGRPLDARELFSTIENIPPALASHASFLDAQLMLAEERYGEAEVIFTDLLSDQGGNSLVRKNLSAIGKADAISGLGNTPEATEFLLSFIQMNPDAPLLSPMFDRIIAWLPEEIITALHPTLQRLAEWLPKAPPTSIEYLYVDAPYAKLELSSSGNEVSDLAVFSLYARALGLHRIATEDSKRQAEYLLRRLRLTAPSHFLTPRSLLTLARWKKEENQTNQAFDILDALRMTARSPLMKGEAAFLDAEIAFENGDSNLAASLFEEAAALLEGRNQESALFNSALARFSEDPSATILIQNKDPDKVAKLTIDLALEKAFSRRNFSSHKASS